MTFEWMNGYKDPDMCRALVEQIRATSTKAVTIMEVCGTHTVSIFKNGIRNLLPGHVTLLSGPGCPVCVTPVGDIDAMIGLSAYDDVVITTFGDLIRVPGSHSSFQEQRAQGADVRIVYSVMDALALAVSNPQKKVVFAGVGFETTAPTVAAAVLEADRLNLENFFVYSAHKLTPPAVGAVMSAGHSRIDGLLLPGHVSVMTGSDYFRKIGEKGKIPCAIAGFEPLDLLRGIAELIRAAEAGETVFVNTYERAVTPDGNKTALGMMHRVFDVKESRWRGVGVIPESGLFLRPEFERFDAVLRFGLNPVGTPDPAGCSCGEILTGRMTPPSCPLYKKRCTPSTPVGPCMVSGEGTCAAYYHYHG
jgi:hydrogenase expression/formation protein HypD